jgi:hypothetical protein
VSGAFILSVFNAQRSSERLGSRFILNSFVRWGLAGRAEQTGKKSKNNNSKNIIEALTLTRDSPMQSSGVNLPEVWRAPSQIKQGQS